MKQKKIVLALAALSMIATLGVGAVHAQDKKAEKGSNQNKGAAVTSPASDAVSMAATAEQLARYGDARKDPLALIMAARLKAEIGTTAEERKKQGKPADDAGAKPGVDTSVAALLARAKSLAGGRQDLVALADETAAASTRGAGGGPKYSNSVVRGVTNDIYHIVFRGGEPAAVALRGDGDSDLDLRVYDENGNLICRSESNYDSETCRWNPRWTGPFRIEVRNLGRLANRYTLITN